MSDRRPAKKAPQNRPPAGHHQPESEQAAANTKVPRRTARAFPTVIDRPSGVPDLSYGTGFRHGLGLPQTRVPPRY